MAKHTRTQASKSPLNWSTKTTKQKAVLLGAALVVLAGATVGILVGTGGGTPAKAKNKSGGTHILTGLGSDKCPLTDVTAPGGKVPVRPALLVKIGNEPGQARPQSGLNEADIVYDTPAEGFIMRYAAVYQCNSASLVGPTRSVRWVDYHMIARPFVEPIIAFAGGINQNQAGVAADKPWLTGVNLLDESSPVAVRTTNRVPPDNLYTNTAALWALYPKLTYVPPPVFSYSGSPVKAATPASSIDINFSYGTDVIWKWDAQSGQWMHTYSGTPDIDTLTTKQVSTTNIVVQVANYKVGPYIESTGGSGDIESQLLGSGTGYVLRNGTSIAVKWHRQNELSPTVYTDAAGAKVSLAPGRTWVEIVPKVQADATGGIVITK
jgi:hypothetical protein